MIFRRRDDDFRSFSLMGFLTSPFRAIGRMLETDDSMNLDRSLVSRLISVLNYPLRLLFAFFSFMIQQWALNRSLSAFLYAAPVMGIVVVFGIAVWTTNFLKETRSVGTSQGYFKAMQELHPDNPENANMFAVKLVELKPENDSFKYQLGLSREHCDDMRGALDIMQHIAPDDEAGYAAAHVWLSQYYLRSQFLGLSEAERNSKAATHFDHALSLLPNDSASWHAWRTALLSRAAYYELQAKKTPKDSPERVKNLKLAISDLKTLVEGELSAEQIQAVPILSRLYKEIGDEKSASSVLNRVFDIIPIARDNPEKYWIWLTLVRCAVQMQDYDLALKIIREGSQLAKSPEVRKSIVSLASEVVLDDANRYSDLTDRFQYKMRLNRLCDAIRYHPRNRAIYLELCKFIASQSNPDFNEKWLNDSVVEASNPSGAGIVHVLVGVHLIAQGNVLEGQKHWRIAEQQFPNTQFVVNNVIDVAATEFPNDFSNMMDMITLAIELFPDQPLLYQTRGMYLKQQGRYQDAVSDFLTASKELPKLLSLHKYLIECYEQLGQANRVVEHKTIIESILSQLDSDQRKSVEASMERLD